MTLIAILLVFALEYYFQWGAEYRQFDWFYRLQETLEDKWGELGFFQGWGGVVLILGLPPIILWLLLSLLSGFFYYTVLLLVSCCILFLTLGPKPLKHSFSTYLAAMERGDEEAGYLSLQQECPGEDIPQSDDLVRNATRLILVESQTRYFSVLCWFIFLGPFGALFYRLAHLYYCYCKRQEYDEHLTILTVLLHWLDWLPARITSLLFLLTGDFVNGFYRVRDYLTDLNASNRQIISETGVSALGIKLGMSESCLQENKDALAMVERTWIVYLVAVVALSPLTFW